MSFVFFLIILLGHAVAKWISFENSQVDEVNFDKFMPQKEVSSSSFIKEGKKFNIAIVTAGALRSFAYTEKSWRRYMLEPWKAHIKIFAHVTASKKCLFSQKALEVMRELATEIEIGYSSTPLIPFREVQKKLPSALKKSDYFRSQAKGMNRGNYFDMHIRRIRAYEMAREYAEKHSFEWDMIGMLRLDTAFYSPIVPFGRIYYGLIEYMKHNKQAAIYVPTPCNFWGVCDRVAFGLPKEMEIYFQHDWPFEVLNWAITPTPANSEVDLVEMTRIKSMMSRDGNSEHLLKCWFIVNNITQVYNSRAMRTMTFFTLRTSTADGYCTLNRNDHMYKYPKVNEFIWEPDKVTAYPDHSSPYKDLDLVADPMQRCGPIHTLNATKVCLTKECNCGKYG